MTSIRKSWWAALALVAFAGCTQEESAPATNPTPVPSAGPAPSTPPPAVSPTEKADLKPEMKPDSPKDDKVPAPAVEAPKIEAPKVEAPKAEEKKDGDKADDKKADDKADAGKLGDEEIAEIKKLPADDQTLALKQLICPVSDEHLGAMGTPLKVTAEGKTFFICCKGCQKEVTKDAKAVLAKLKD